jgi:predicted methyltransferase
MSTKSSLVTTQSALAAGVLCGALALAAACSGGLQAAGGLKLDSKTGFSAKVDGKTGSKVEMKADGSTSTPKDTEAALKEAISGSHRSEENRARDKYNHPKETLMFFGLRADMSVLEVEPGSDGWFTEILAPTLKDDGVYLATNFDPNGPEKSPLTRVGKAFQAKLDSNPDVYGKVKTVLLTEEYVLGEPDSLDMVVTFRNSHLWKQDKIEDRVYGAMFKVLKPGGVLGLVQHRADAGENPSKSFTKGYLPQPYVIERVEKAGFVFEEESHINANSWDTKDYPKGVWTLPPSFAQGDKDREKYEKIGESDRMTLRFRKPKESAPPATDASAEAGTGPSAEAPPKEAPKDAKPPAAPPAPATTDKAPAAAPSVPPANTGATAPPPASSAKAP